MTIIDIKGVCPTCGEDNLHVNSTVGLIYCMNPDCVRPGAANEILNDPVREHMVVFHVGFWTVLHPLAERLDGRLLDCDAGHRMEHLVAMGVIVKMDARYWLRRTKEGPGELVEVSSDV